MTTTTNDTATNEQRDYTQTMLGQIGRMNLLAISGGRVHYIPRNYSTVILPVRYGYSVEVEYMPVPDTYTVRRVLTRGAKRWVKREWTLVYGTEVGEVAYVASCYGDDA